MPITKEINRPYVCINCGEKIKELYKKYSNTVKTVNCVSGPALLTVSIKPSNSRQFLLNSFH